MLKAWSATWQVAQLRTVVAEALEECASCVDMPVGVDGRDGAGRIGERFEIHDRGCGVGGRPGRAADALRMAMIAAAWVSY